MLRFKKFTYVCKIFRFFFVDIRKVLLYVFYVLSFFRIILYDFFNLRIFYLVIYLIFSIVIFFVELKIVILLSGKLNKVLFIVKKIIFLRLFF